MSTSRSSRGITPLRGETELDKLQRELDLFTQWAEEGDLSWPRGSELASDEFVAWAQQQRSAQGELLELETVKPTDEEWFRFQSDKINTEMNTTSPEILVPVDLRKIELLEEVLHHIQQRIPNFNKQFPYPMDELHVKDFMIRYRDLFGLSPEDVRVLQQLMKNQMASGTDILGRPLILPESAKISVEGIPTSSGEESFLDMSADEIQKIMQDEITNDLDLTTPRE